MTILIIVSNFGKLDNRINLNVGLVNFRKLVENHVSSKSTRDITYTIEKYFLKGKDNPSFDRNIGIIYKYLGESKLAHQYFLHAYDEDDLLSTYFLADIAFENDEWEVVAGYLSEVAIYNETLINSYIQNLITEGDIIDGVQLANDYIVLIPDSALTYYQLANMNWALGNRSETIRALAQAMINDPDKDSIYYLYQSARLDYLEQRYSEAEQTIELLLNKNPGYFQGLVLAGQIYLAIDQPKLASQFLEKAIAIDVGYVYSHEYVAQAYVELGMFTSAVKEYKIASILSDEPKKYLNALQNIYDDLQMDCYTLQIKNLISESSLDSEILKLEFPKIDSYCAQK
jgi:tetratricopeptide (TPR) repeat protein